MTCGIDLVEIKRIEKMAERHSALLGRFFTPGELAYCQKRGRGRYASLAAVFAAKEAFWKACGTGFRQGRWTDVEVFHDDEGAPCFRLYGPYAVLGEQYGMPSLSLTHDGGYAAALVVWEKK